MTDTKPQPDTEARITALMTALEDQKGQNLFLQRMGEANDIADAVIIATASSVRHAQGLARALVDVSKASGQKYARMEGFEAGQWILLDCNDIIIHIFQEDVRDLYRLEELWTDSWPE